MRMKVLLIGGTGVLSTDIMRLSLDKGHQVYILNRGNRKQLVPNEVICLKADINKSNEVIHAIDPFKFDVVVDFLCFNKKELLNHVEIFEDKCKQFVFISSATAYFKKTENETITEKTPIGNPNWNYALNKSECEALLKEKCSLNGMKYTIVRPYVTYGDTRIPFAIIPNYGWHWTFVARILNRKPIVVWDKGEAICTLTHTTDFAKGVVGLFGNEKGFNEDFHITCDERHKWRDVAEIIGEIVDRKNDNIRYSY